MKIIDVSEHNGVINFKKVKASGVDGVIIRAGYGRGNVDKRFHSNIKAAIKNGLEVGIYWFSYAYTIAMVTAESKYCIDLIKSYKITLPVFFDWEYDSMIYAKKNGVTPSKEVITKYNKIFCERIKEAGYVAGYYANLDYCNNYINPSDLSDYKFWYAQYSTNRAKTCDYWQYSDKGRVSGINGNVDMSESYTVAKIAKKYHTVKKGDTLTSIARKYKTTIKKLLSLNDIENPDIIEIGQKVRVK